MTLTVATVAMHAATSPVATLSTMHAARSSLPVATVAMHAATSPRQGQICQLIVNTDDPAALTAMRADEYDRLDPALDRKIIYELGDIAGLEWATPQQYLEDLATIDECLERLAFIDARIAECERVDAAARVAVSRAFSGRRCVRRTSAPVAVPCAHRSAYRHRGITSQPACAHAPPSQSGLHSRPTVDQRSLSKVARDLTIPVGRSTSEATAA